MSELNTTLPGEDVLIVELRCGFCPIEVEGTILGKPFYLRMRESIAFSVAKDPCGDPVGLHLGHGEGFFISSRQRPEIDAIKGRPGGDKYPGRATDEDVFRCLAVCANIYLQETSGP